MGRASARYLATALVRGAIAGALTVSIAHAESPAFADPLVRARAAVDDLRFDDAIELAKPSLNDANAKRRVRALEVTAVAHLVAGKYTEGKAEVALLYELSPGFVQSDRSLPPRVTSVFDDEAAKMHARAVTMSLRPSAKNAATDPGAFELVTHGEAARVDVSCRTREASAYQPVATTRAGSASEFRLPTLRAHRCYATALDGDGVALGRLGSAEEPIEVLPEARPLTEPTAASSGAPLSKWWFWTAVGVVAGAGGATAIVLATRSSSSSRPAADITATARPVSIAW